MRCSSDEDLRLIPEGGWPTAKTVRAVLSAHLEPPNRQGPRVEETSHGGELLPLSRSIALDHLASRGFSYATEETVIRRRPIPKFKLHPEASQHYELILDGAVRLYRDGREVCVNSAAGWREYKRRVSVMLQRQGRRCCLCNRPLALANATFEHQRRRGMGAAWRDDRIEKDGEPWNGAAHWTCNSEKG